MNHNHTVKTTAYIAGMVVLFFILIAVLGIMSGILPQREYADAPEPTPTPEVVNTPAPPVAPTPTPDPEHPEVPDMILDEEHQVFAVNVTYSRGGTATPSGMTTVVKGGSITIMILPDEGYAVESVTVNGETVQTEGSLTLSDVQANQSIYVSFLHVAAPTPPVGTVNTPDPDWNPFASPTPEVKTDPDVMTETE